MLSSRTLSGRFVRKIQALTNDPKHPTESLVCQGRVLVPVKFSKKFVRFPPARMSDPAQSQTITIERGDGGPLDLKIISPNIAGADASLRVLEPGERYELTLTMSPPRPANKKRILWKLETGVPEAPKVSLSAYLTVTPRVKAVPPKFTLPNSVASDTQRRVRLVWDGQPAGKILGASLSDKKLSVTVEQVKGRDVIVLDIPAGYQRSRANLAVVVRTDDATMPRLRIPISPGRRVSARRPAKPASVTAKQRPNVRRVLPSGSGVE
ncbi:MAG: hypothetical protein IID40_01695 [Planctomycetes bacterium]|nr:hypothetical protein [Planctomycetota bacterium]